MVSSCISNQRPRVWINRRGLVRREQAKVALVQKQIRLSLINTIATAINHDTTAEQIIQNTIEQISFYFPRLRVSYSEVNEQGRLAILYSVQAVDVPSLKGVEIDLSVAPNYLACLQEGQTVIVRDTAHDVRLAPLHDLFEQGDIRAFVDVPLLQANRIVGLLCFDAPQVHPWNEHEIATLSEVGQYLCIALKNAQHELERRWAEAALRESEERYRVISNLISDYAYSFRVEPGGKLITEWITEDSFKRITGFTHQESDEGGPYVLYHPDDVAQVLTDMQNLLGGHPVTGEYRIITKSGELRWLRIYRYAEWDEEQQCVTRLYGVAQDITEMKHSEKRKFELELERERIRILTGFIEGTAHEFRTPLATINTSAYLMSRSDHAQDRREKLARIQDQIGDMTDLLDAMLLLLRLDDTSKLFIEKIELYRVMRTVQDSLHTLIQNKNLHLTVDIEGQLPPVECDFSEITRAFKNILENAVQFTPAGGKITLSVRGKGDNIIVEIGDNGSGISNDALPHIFESFYREDKARTTRGFGLGLTIACRVIERYQGRIEVESQVGSGSVFRVILPGQRVLA